MSLKGFRKDIVSQINRIMKKTKAEGIVVLTLSEEGMVISAVGIDEEVDHKATALAVWIGHSLKGEGVKGDFVGEYGTEGELH